MRAAHTLKPIARLNSRGTFVAERTRHIVAEAPAYTAYLMREQWHWLLMVLFLFVIVIAPAYWSRVFWFNNESPLWYQPLIPLLALWSVWHWRKQLGNIYRQTLNLPEDSPNRRGKLWPLAIGCILMLFAYATQTAGLSILAWVVMTLGIVYYAFGREIMTYLLPELVLVLTMIPLPATVITLAQRSMQLAMTSIGAEMIRSTGVSQSKATGNLIEMGKNALEVTPGASGVAILVPLLALTFWFAVMRRLSVGSSVLFFAMSALVAFVLIVARLVFIGILVNSDKSGFADALLYAPSWLAVLPAFGLLWFLSGKLRLR